eukprot:TRINITY_DN5074_c0_g1_i1.p1 TRINITY_DN5074_c0_g1~~TRINITY_DN5074_c0_g1_i1.p1  ORF type:complete len:432 (+),score=161.52 TRINITY_DN5074_c0_g1_i1:59-1297(+)
MAGEASWCSGENKRKAHLKRMVDPRNLNWANDKDAFGKKMMEKMGWNQGEGLGASGNGEITSIKVVHKMDRVGINEGETIDRSNAWQENQSAFSDILANLAAANASGNNSNGSDDGGAEKKRKRKKKSDDTTSNGSSTKKKRKRTTDKPVRRIGAAQILHAKAKRQRVGKHAVKSKEDLQHILGLPTGPSKDSKAGLSDPVGNGAEGKAKEEVVVDKTDVKVTVSSLSVTDYFKQKALERQQAIDSGKRGANVAAAVPAVTQRPSYEEQLAAEEGSDVVVEEEDSDTAQPEDQPQKKKKKSKKVKIAERPQKKRRKSEGRTKAKKEEEEDEDEQNEVEAPVVEKKKRRKSSDVEKSETSDDSSEAVTTKQKRRKKKGNSKATATGEEDSTNSSKKQVVTTKRKKKSKRRACE